MRASNRTRLYSQYRQEQVQEKLSQLGIFSYMDMQYAPRDTTAACDTLDVTMQATFAKPLDAELELNVVTKSNDQTFSWLIYRRKVVVAGKSNSRLPRCGNTTLGKVREVESPISQLFISELFSPPPVCHS